MTQGDVGLAGDHGWAGVLLGGNDGGINRVWIMAIDFQHMPARGRKAHRLVRYVGNIDSTIDRDVVVVPEHDQVR